MSEAGWGVCKHRALSCLFLKTSVTYHSHAIRLTHLKSTIQWFLYHHRVVQNHRQNPLWNILINPKRNPIPISNASPFLPNPSSPDRGHHKSTLCLNTFAHSGYLCVGTYNVWSLGTGVFDLASWFHGHPALPLLLPSRIPGFRYTRLCFLSPTDGNLG